MRVAPPPDHEDLKDRLHELLVQKIKEIPGSRCCRFEGATDPRRGAGVVKVAGRVHTLARVLLYVYRGLELGFDLDDHATKVRRTCATRGCANWEHWQPVPRAAAPARRAA